MKKFLFTLVALLMAGSVCAQDKVFIADQDLKGQPINTDIELYIQGHFEYAPSAWQINFNKLPQGFYILDTEAGADSEISYINSNGRTKKSAPLYVFENGNLMCAQAEMEYYQVDGAWVPAGAVNWAPGDYDELGILYVQIDETFEGGDIEYTCMVDYGPESDMDPRQDQFPWHNGTIQTDLVCNVGEVEADKPAPKPTFNWSAESFTMGAVCEGHEVTLMIGEQVVDNPYTVEQTYEEQTIKFTAFTVANDDETANSEAIDTTVVVPAKQKTPSQKPSVIVTPGDDVYTIEATGTGTVELYVNGEKVDSPYEIARPEYGQADITVTAKASNLDVDPDGEIQYEIAWCDDVEVTVPAKEPTYYQTPDPEITVVTDNDAQTVTITATGEGTVTLKVTGATGTVGQASGQGTCSVVVPFGDAVDYVNAYATATAAGEFVYPGDATKDMIEIPAKPAPQPQTAQPTIDVVTNEDGTVTVKVTGEGTLNVTIEGYDLELDVITYTGESPYEITLQQAEEAQEVTVSATAQKPGELESEPVNRTFVIEAKDVPPTPVLLQGEIQFGAVDQATGQFTVTYTGDEEGVVITLNDAEILPVRGTEKKFQLPTYGEYPVVATATAPGYDNEVTGEATLVWTKPEVTPPTAPQITIDTEASAIIVGASPVEGATVTLYQVDDATGANPQEIENPTAFPRKDVQYSVWVIATAVNEAGQATSTVTEVIIPAAEETGINEMMGGKTISNVRYFNMAGQEMQEANGMTIVVTTYTDGTQTAVKVMK